LVKVQVSSFQFQAKSRQGFGEEKDGALGQRCAGWARLGSGGFEVSKKILPLTEVTVAKKKPVPQALFLFFCGHDRITPQSVKNQRDTRT
jgi:hypothetical protein